ncbi:solute carrier family 25 member 35-like isoform X1 [Cimex lectularius]|uniref:Solute carrier family 25 member 35 n=1 Tax=Cimex lectularius TaxID=79782 RepID=A0A8I6S203_CIMLE|nr:solute carrier family 25 member 35-like isoform X1 [Cimex lectularius]
MEFIIGASSAVGAVIFTNPLEVVKTRFQLQGELKKKGQYTVHYKNFFHAFYLIGKTEGVLALQKGLASAAIHQVLLNGVRLGGYHLAEQRKLNLKENGEVSLVNTTIIGVVMGFFGAYAGSPLYLAKIRLQSQANKSIAVGYQHEAKNTFGILNSVYREGGITGLWRGVIGSVPRICVGSASQLTAFYVSKEFLANNKYFVIHSGLLNTFVSSMIGGIFVAITMGPLDVISTRLYNQGITKDGKGILYNGYFDCVTKIWKTEGFKGFYKGIVPCYMRIGPHTVLCFVFWDELKKLQAYLEKK